MSSEPPNGRINLTILRLASREATNRLSSNVKIKGILSVPGDKSISHRALIFSALSSGTVSIKGLSPAEDCQSTATCLRRLGLRVNQSQNPGRGAALIHEAVTIESPGLNALNQSHTPLFAGNSGTTIRVMAGLVAGLPFKTRFDGDQSLRKRPMSRVLVPLAEMGAQIDYEKPPDAAQIPGCAPFSIKGGNLQGQAYSLKVASAQVQTALLLAGLQADGMTSVKMPSVVRDHTERMFAYMGIPFTRQQDGTITVSRLVEPVPPYTISVPGDISSAAFFMVAAACVPGSDVLLKNIGINPGRTLVIDVLKAMGADIRLESQAEITGEPVADIRVRYAGRLKGTTISGDTVAQGIDEIPVLALAGATCDGIFRVSGAEELRHKESDRLNAIVENFRRAGLRVQELADGFDLEGAGSINGNSPWATYKDHRLAMTGLIANCIFEQPVQIEETDSIRISYPGFAEHLDYLLGQSRSAV